MIELTLTNGAALVTGLFGLLFVFNGFRQAFWDETLIGAILLIVTWWLL